MGVGFVPMLRISDASVNWMPKTGPLGVVGPEQRSHWADLRDLRLIHASWNIVQSEKTDASLSEGSQVWCQSAVITGSGRGAGRNVEPSNPVVPPLLQSSGAVDGNVGAAREGLGYVSVHMTTVHVNPTKEVLGDLLGPVQSRSRVSRK